MLTSIYVGTGENERIIKANLFGRWLHVARCRPADGVVGVSEYECAMGDEADAKEATMWFEIVAVGESCRYFRPEHIGGLVILPAAPFGKKDWSHKVGKGEFVVREEWWEHPDGDGLPCFAVFTEG